MATRTKSKATRGRPRTIDRDAIVKHFAEGGTWLSVVKKGLISGTWALATMMDRDDEFAKRITRAEELGAAVAVGEAVEIVDTATPGEARVAEIRAKHRYWVASRRDPKRWGDRQAVEHSGPGGGPVGVIAIPVRAETPAGT